MSKKFSAVAYLKRQSKYRDQMADVAMKVAKIVCKMGYSPDEADSIIELTPDQYEELDEWYAKWSNEKE